MLSKPKAGWTLFKVGDFERSVSYITPVPEELLRLFAEYYAPRRLGCVTLDEEGHEFVLVLSDVLGMAVFEENEEGLLVGHHLASLDQVKALAQELICDIESCINEWAEFIDPDPLLPQFKSVVIELLKDHIKNLKMAIGIYRHSGKE